MKRNRFFSELTEAVARASGQKSLKLALSRLRANYGYDYFAFLNLHAQKVHAVSDYPKEWQAIYLERSYTIIDPVITTAKRLNRPFEWSIDRERRFAGNDVKRFYDDAAGFGIRSGISIPVRTGKGQYALFTLASRDPETAKTAELDIVSAVSAVALLHAKFAQEPVAPPTLANLNTREASFLKMIAEGMRMADIANVEGLAYKTVVFHINKAKAKLDVYTLPHATARATKLSLI
ncbi:autoinducer binding domain-containing protein [Pararhizobium sp. LjRoot235]|uniref:autoinducer binding domain-containing protein n=1 Tax=Pararhizobium sp. LjRoot235 TaxID=3342291 RepID=UPI003F4F525D